MSVGWEVEAASEAASIAADGVATAAASSKVRAELPVPAVDGAKGGGIVASGLSSGVETVAAPCAEPAPAANSEPLLSTGTSENPIVISDSEDDADEGVVVMRRRLGGQEVAKVESTVLTGVSTQSVVVSAGIRDAVIREFLESCAMTVGDTMNCAGSRSLFRALLRR